MATLTASIDPQRCVCSGYCARLVPSVFKMAAPRPTLVEVAAISGALAEVIEEAADICPTKAITIGAGGRG